MSMEEAVRTVDPTAGSATIRRVEIDRPWRWLAAGWQDLRAMPGVSLVYGVAFAIAGYLITIGLWLAGTPYLVLPMGAGFMLVGPIVAVGLYEASRRRAAGEPVSLGRVMGAFRHNPTQIALMGVALLVLFFVWVRLAILIFMLFFGLRPPSLETLFVTVFFSASSLPFLIFGTAVGAVLAAFAFAISAVSVPMLLDRAEVNVFSAIAISVRCVLANLPAMALWAALIVVFTGAGLVTLYVGLIVTLPLIGHATWHAYKDLVSDDEHQ
jgi:uncharacterized membrane protein